MSASPIPLRRSHRDDDERSYRDRRSREDDHHRNRDRHESRHATVDDVRRWRRIEDGERRDAYDSGIERDRRHRNRHLKEAEDEKRASSSAGRHRSGHRDDDGASDVEKERRQSRQHSRRETSEERHERKKRKRDRQEREAEERAKAVDTLLYSSEATAKDRSNVDTETFRWAKKAERERKQGLTAAEARERDERRRREMEEERRALNIRLAQREKEKKEREEQDALMARQNVNAAEAQWVADEDKFDLKQARAAAIRRARDDRAKPIDLYVIDVRWLDMDANPVGSYDDDGDDELDDDIFRVDPQKPHALIDQFDLDEVEELHTDIIKFLTLELNESKRRFWSALLVVCNDKLSELRAEAGVEAPEERPWKDLRHKAEVDELFSTKSPEELHTIKAQVQAKLDQDDRIQVEHWLNYKRAIEVWQAKAKLGDYYETILVNRVQHLKERQRKEEERRRVLGLPSLAEEKAQKAAEAARRRAARDADQGQDAGIAMARAMMAREAENNELGDADDEFNKDEALDDIEAASQRGSYAMDDKYRPRKPNYYNKVHTGYDWNKYNQTHYDSDNPPPKLVQGYKFNIFYPDLIDKSKPPTYRIVREPGNEETCLILFEAGPPYETIAFRIVNKKWNTKPQRGFKAVFDRGMLQLWFNFQRIFYRK